MSDDVESPHAFPLHSFQGMKEASETFLVELIGCRLYCILFSLISQFVLPDFRPISVLLIIVFSFGYCRHFIQNVLMFVVMKTFREREETAEITFFVCI